MNDEMKAQQDIQRLSALVRAQQITIDKLEQALAAPVQEPIGYVKLIDTPFGEKLKPVLTIAVPVGSKLYTTPPAAPVPLTDEQARDMPDCWVVIKDGRIIATHDEPCHYDGIQAVRYAPTAQRQWVGLTDEEMNDITCGMIKGWVVERLAIAIEAKLKEKNI